ncbi:NUDIX hydrolase [Chitinophaga tropicalis]|uniref:Nudix hydrolase domain-containing protein n=1 Tax=Chitinophaga tropicalis TaxID=2683588 RepID=A0A7K1UC83_9BACT|nr:NUDIX hydrolase [Chitinophaga tropicalis]MVT11994.1 hypothetical protein [Chitinophaga tropicalis]
MKYITSCLLFLLLFNAATAQTKADSISRIFPKVIITNNKQEILLAFDSNRKAYELPSIGFLEGPISLREYMSRAAKEIGVTYKSFRLGGMFTYIFPNNNRTFVRPYFIMQMEAYSNGQSFSDSSYKWFSLPDAVKAIPYPASAQILQKVMTQPAYVWAAAFEEYGYTNPVDREKIKFRVLEDFYKLNEIQ